MRVFNLIIAVEVADDFHEGDLDGLLAEMEDLAQRHDVVEAIHDQDITEDN